MSYSVQQVRYTLECDICGVVEKRDIVQPSERAGDEGWSTATLGGQMFFCCPACFEKLQATALERPRALAKAKAEQQATCSHNYQQRGFLRQCTKCERWQ